MQLAYRAGGGRLSFCSSKLELSPGRSSAKQTSLSQSQRFLQLKLLLLKHSSTQRRKTRSCGHTKTQPQKTHSCGHELARQTWETDTVTDRDATHTCKHRTREAQRHVEKHSTFCLRNACRVMQQVSLQLPLCETVPQPALPSPPLRPMSALHISHCSLHAVPVPPTSVHCWRPSCTSPAATAAAAANPPFIKAVCLLQVVCITRAGYNLRHVGAKERYNNNHLQREQESCQSWPGTCKGGFIALTWVGLVWQSTARWLHLVSMPLLLPACRCAPIAAHAVVTLTCTTTRAQVPRLSPITSWYCVTCCDLPSGPCHRPALIYMELQQTALCARQCIHCSAESCFGQTASSFKQAHNGSLVGQNPM